MYYENESAQGEVFEFFQLCIFHRLMDSVTLTSSRRKGFRWTCLPDLTLMSGRVELFELNFLKLQRKDIPRKRSIEIQCLHDGYVDAVVTSWEALNLTCKLTCKCLQVCHHQCIKAKQLYIFNIYIYSRYIQYIYIYIIFNIYIYISISCTYSL